MKPSGGARTVDEVGAWVSGGSQEKTEARTAYEIDRI